MEREAHVQADGDVGGLPAEREVNAGATREGSEEPAAVAWAALPDGRRNAARCGAGVGRVAGEQDRRPQREALSAGKCVGADRHRRQRHANYVQQHGDALYRRSMYTYWKRMAMLPDMDVFDAPMRDVVCTRRQRTDTPLQALVTMNDVHWVEAARALAQRVIEKGGKQPQQRIDLMSEILLSHDPPPKMAAVLENSLTQMQKHYAADPKAAHELIAVGEKKSDPSIPEPELAAWTMVASEMLNLDETVTK